MHATEDRLRRFASIANEQRRIYAAMTSAMDDVVGRVLEKLTEAGLDEETLVFFFSDNGGPTMIGTTRNGSSNAPLRGSKRTTLEGGIRVPFVMRWPGKLPAGTTFDKPIIQLDVLPTALVAAGVALDPAWEIDGVDLMPFLLGETSVAPHERLYWRFGQQMALREGPWKLVRYDRAADGDPDGVTDVRLYNLANDLGEAHDLAAHEPAKVKQLMATWQRWNGELQPPLWGAASEGRPRGAARD
jgi:arylsulfatase A-like enzyme